MIRRLVTDVPRLSVANAANHPHCEVDFRPLHCAGSFGAAFANYYVAFCFSSQFEFFSVA